MEDEEKETQDTQEYVCKIIFDAEGEDARICGTTVKKADVIKICISKGGNIMGVTLKDKGDLWV